MKTKILSVAGVLLAVGVMIVSGVVNARYGMSLAREGFDQYVMLLVAVFADAGKAVCWIFFVGAIVRRDVLAAVASLVIFSACLTYAVAGSLGYVAMHRAQSTAVVQNDGVKLRAIEVELQRKHAELQALGFAEPPTVVAKRIEALKQDRRFATSSQCRDATTDLSRTFCATLARLQAEEQKAEALSRLQDEIRTLAQQREKMSGAAVADKGDFQGALIAQLTNLQLSTVQMSLAILFVMMVESGACFLLWLSLNYADMRTASATKAAEETTATPKFIGDMLEFAEECVELTAGEVTEVAEFARCYKRWCANRGLRPVSDEVLAQQLDQICRVGGVATVVKGGTIHLSDVSLNPEAAGG